MLRCATMAKARPRVCLIGLDSVAPALLFHTFWPHLPNIRQLALAGGAGVLASCDPPITVPAWAAMMTGHDPGTLGLYGFHDRADHSYHHRRLASSSSYTLPPLWEILTAAGRRSCVLGMPHTYPTRPFSGRMVTGCLTPSEVGLAVFPTRHAAATRATLNVPALDTTDFRHLSLRQLVMHVRRASRALFRLACHWASAVSWDFFALVDMGADRLQHALWRFCCADHPLFEPGHPLQGALLAYYVLLDRMVGRLIACLRPNDLILVVSDHGACAMHRAVAINQWLIDHDYLVLHTPPTTPQALDLATVDWRRTRAWADGGYVGRLYVNQRGREPHGIVPKRDTPALLAQISTQLAALAPPPPQPHRFLRPHQIYREVRGVAPDLLLYFANLRWRAIGQVGLAETVVHHNDRGPDGANHDSHGVIIMRSPRGARLEGRHSLYDIAPTVLEYLQVAVPPTMLGRPLSI